MKEKYGIVANVELPRKIGFCEHEIIRTPTMTELAPSFSDNPFVVGFNIPDLDEQLFNGCEVNGHNWSL
jgi:hypothetical protein